MSMAAKLAALATDGKPVRVGVIGAGKFGSMFFAGAADQVCRSSGSPISTLNAPARRSRASDGPRQA